MSREQQFRKLFEDYYPMLCRIALSYIPNSEECEDIVQESFVSVWNKKIDELPEKEFAAYMVRAVKNNCISFLRKQKTTILSFEEAAIHDESQHLEDDPEAETVRYDELLERLLDALPPKCRDVFLLSKLHQLKYKEIAEKLNISEKTVENHMGKALRVIREQLQSGRYLISLLLILFMLK